MHFGVQARLTQHLKDVCLILDAASQQGQRLALSEAHCQLLKLAEPLRLVWTGDGAAEIDMPWKIFFYSVVASLAGIVTSLLTKLVPSERLDRFYLLSRTPLEPGETNDVPCQLPAKSNSTPRRMLVSSCGLENQSLFGFARECLDSQFAFQRMTAAGLRFLVN